MFEYAIISFLAFIILILLMTSGNLKKEKDFYKKELVSISKRTCYRSKNKVEIENEFHKKFIMEK